MSRLALALLLLAPAFAGCAAEPAPPARETMLYGLDGRWPFDAERATAVVARAGIAPPLGALVLGEALGARAVGDVLAADAGAAAALGIGSPMPGEAHVARAWAEREGARENATLTLRAHAWPDPRVATYFEMERVPACDARPDAKLCFLPVLREGEARLRLRVDPGARDAAFLPDLVELGPNARPAWWNGSFDGPDGRSRAFQAHAPLEGDLVAGEVEGEMEAGEWTVRFRLETRHGVAPAGAAGIVRVREPGYLWFDDALQRIEDPLEQARALVAEARPTSVTVRVARVVEELPLGHDVLLHLEDARTLVGTSGVTALLLDLDAVEERALERSGGPDALTQALRARPLSARPYADAPTGDLVFAAPATLALADLPPVAGAGAPSLALAGRPPVSERARLDGLDAPGTTLLLAHAEGPVPWTLPAGARWSEARDALENLSRSRTLALASADLLLAPIATARVEMGEGNTTRSLVAIGGVAGGPDAALWTSAALVGGAGRPVAPRIVLPLADGADRDEVARRALDLWSDHGVVLDR